MLSYFFFFASRRRHTRSKRDWSSDVCSSDLGAWRRPQNLAGLAIPLVALAIMVPRIVAIVKRWDAVHFTSATVEAQGGVLAAALQGTRPLDLLNLILLVSPLAPLIPVL